MEKPNSKATEIKITLSLFADDTAIVGESWELEKGIQIVKDVMESFEEKMRQNRKGPFSEHLKPRRLGCSAVGWYINRIKSWNDTGMSTKEEQATKKKASTNYRNWHFVESGIFDCATRPWYSGEIKSLQFWIDKNYRHIWSNKKGPPLFQTEKESKHARH